jgi:hypothetical protein
MTLAGAYVGERSVLVGQQGQGSLTVDAGGTMFQSNWIGYPAGEFTIGQYLGGQGTVIVSSGANGAGSLVSESQLNVGGLGDGTLCILGGKAKCHVLNVAVGAGSTGSVGLLTGPTGLPPELAADFTEVGVSGSGTFIQQSGTHTITSNVGFNGLILGEYAGAKGYYQLRDGLLQVGYPTNPGVIDLGSSDSEGTFDQRGGLTTTDQFFVGAGSSVSRGTLLLSGNAQITVRDSFQVGSPDGTFPYSSNGVGTVTQNGGTLLANRFWMPEGEYNLNTGTLRVAQDGTIGTSATGMYAAYFSQSAGEASFRNLYVFPHTAYLLIGGSLKISGDVTSYINSNGDLGLRVAGGKLISPRAPIVIKYNSAAKGAISLQGVSDWWTGGTIEITDQDVTLDATNVFGTSLTLDANQSDPKMLIVDRTLTIPPGSSITLAGGGLSAGSLDTGGNPSAINWTAGSVDLGSASLVVDTGGLLGSAVSIDSARQLSAAQGELVGNTGSGSLTHIGGSNSTPILIVAEGNTGVGTYTIGAGSLSIGTGTSGQLFVGDFGNGTFLHSGGVVTVNGQLVVGRTGTGHGTYSLSGGALAADSEVVGSNNSGTFIQTGGTNSIAGTLTIGLSAAGGLYRLAGGSVIAPSLSINSAGRLQYDAGDLSVATVSVNSAGQLVLGPSGNKVLRAINLSIGGASGSWAGKVDLSNNYAIIDYANGSPSPIAIIEDQIKSGFANGSWTGNGITSSSAAGIAAGASPHRTALGVVEASQLYSTFPQSFAGQQIDSSSILIRYTYAGDGNLNGSVDLTDFTYLAANFNGTAKTWLQGDYNYDGSVDLSDFTFLASNFNQAFAGDDAGVVVPEPTAAALATPAALWIGMMRRLRRRARTSTDALQ